ncbi:unnamed protein product, partial [Gulo gulo]
MVRTSSSWVSKVVLPSLLLPAWAVDSGASLSQRVEAGVGIALGACGGLWTLGILLFVTLFLTNRGRKRLFCVPNWKRLCPRPMRLRPTIASRERGGSLPPCDQPPNALSRTSLPTEGGSFWPAPPRLTSGQVPNLSTLQQTWTDVGSDLYDDRTETGVDLRCRSKGRERHVLDGHLTAWEAGVPLLSAPRPDLAEAELNERFTVLFPTCHSKQSNSKIPGRP